MASDEQAKLDAIERDMLKELEAAHERLGAAEARDRGESAAEASGAINVIEDLYGPHFKRGMVHGNVMNDAYVRGAAKAAQEETDGD